MLVLAPCRRWAYAVVASPAIGVVLLGAERAMIFGRLVVVHD